MIFGWGRAAAFFTVAALVAWILYPNEYFLGMMRRQAPDRSQAVASFKRYLSEKPFNKGATLALAAVYESIGEPQAAVRELAALYRHRRGDRYIGREYLDLLERAGLMDQARKFRWELFTDLRRKPGADRRELEDLLYGYYQAADQQQDEAGALKALLELEKIAKNPESYRYEILRIFMERRDYPVVSSRLEQDLKLKPFDLDARGLLTNVHRLRGDDEAALVEIGKALLLHPRHPEFLLKRVSIHESRGHFGRAVKDLNVLAVLFPGRKAILQRRAYDTYRSGRFDQAAELYTELLQRFPSDRRLWRDWIWACVDSKMNARAVHWLKRYLKLFPEEPEFMSLLAGLHDSEGRFEEALPLYARLTELTPEERGPWLSLSYGLMDRDRRAQAVPWIEKFIQRFPMDSEGVDLLAHAYEVEGKINEAAALLGEFLAGHPHDRIKAVRLLALLETSGKWEQARELSERWSRAEVKDSSWLAALARIASAQGRPEESLAYTRRWLAREGEKSESLRHAGREAYFAGHLAPSRDWLARAYKLAPEDGETLYYLAEVEFARGLKETGRHWALKALERLPPPSEDSGFEALRRRLRLESHLGWSPELAERFRAAFTRHPERALLEDWITAMISRQLDASEPLSFHERSFKGYEKERRRLQFQNSFNRKDWSGAIASLEGWGDSLNEPDLRDALGEAYLRAGRWREAERLFSGPGGNHHAHPVGLHRELHERYDHTVGSTFRHTQLSSQFSRHTGLYYEGYVGSKLKLGGRWESGQYRIAASDFKRSAHAFSGRLEYQAETMKAALLGQLSSGARRDRLSPGLWGRWEPREGLWLEGEYRHQGFWDDFPQAVASGGLASEAKSAVEWRVLGPVYLGARYQYNHYTTAEGRRAWKNQFEPQAAYHFSKAPQASLVYQWTIERADGEQEFFNDVPLIRRVKAQYAGLGFSHWIKPSALRFDAYVYNGHDAGRRLKFFKLDLFGAAVSASWSPAAWLKVVPEYEYGRSASSGISGEAHTVKLRVEGRWFGNEKNDMSRR